VLHWQGNVAEWYKRLLSHSRRLLLQFHFRSWEPRRRKGVREKKRKQGRKENRKHSQTFLGQSFSEVSASDCKHSGALLSSQNRRDRDNTNVT
jgi:hypothetical protein